MTTNITETSAALYKALHHLVERLEGWNSDVTGANIDMKPAYEALAIADECPSLRKLIYKE